MSSSAPSNLIPVEALPEDLRAIVGLQGPPSQRPSPELGARPKLDGARAHRPDPDDDLDFVGKLIARYAAEASTCGRNNALFDLISQVRDDGQPIEMARAAAQLFVEKAPPTNPAATEGAFPLEEALAVVESVYRAPARDPWPSRTRSVRAQVIVNGRQMREVADDIEHSLVEAAADRGLYRRGNRLVQLRRDDDEVLIVVALDHRQVRGLANEVADFIEIRRHADGAITHRHARPPVDAVDTVVGRGHWEGLPILGGIAEAPVVRSDGSILTDPGYDEATRLYYDPAPGLAVHEVPDRPTAEEVKSAVALLDDLLAEFPFDSEASRANAFGLLITAVARLLIPGLVPMGLVAAPQAGTGKSLLVSLVGRVATGRPTPAMSWPANEEEAEKRISAKLLAGHSMLLLDNLHDGRPLKSAALDALLTTDVWEGRLLGQSTILQLPHKMVTAATGNNMTIAGDLQRRCYLIRLDAKVARPEERSFRRPDINQYTDDHRGELLAAIHTLVRAWEAAGRPGPSSGIRLASYQSWVDVVGGICEVAGISGFLENRAELRAVVDDDTVEWARFLDGLHSCTAGLPQTVADLRRILDEDEKLQQVMPRNLVESLAAAHGDQARATRLGNRLRSLTGRRFNDDGLRVERAGQDPSTKAVRWRITTDAG